MGEEKQIAHLEAIRKDVRDEIKKRIEQRDKYSIQLTIALGAILTVAFSTQQPTVLLAAPLVSIYFTVLILYSYRVHNILARYLREEIEPELASLCGTSNKKEWENYYQSHAVPGIRRSFFLIALWVICFASPIYLWLLNHVAKVSSALSIVAGGFYLLAALWITIYFFLWRK